MPANKKWFPLTISLPIEMQGWVRNKKSQGFVISKLVSALVMAEWERENKHEKAAVNTDPFFID